MIAGGESEYVYDGLGVQTNAFACRYVPIIAYVTKCCKRVYKLEDYLNCLSRLGFSLLALALLMSFIQFVTGL